MIVVDPSDYDIAGFSGFGSMHTLTDQPPEKLKKKRRIGFHLPPKAPSASSRTVSTK